MTVLAIKNVSLSVLIRKRGHMKLRRLQPSFQPLAAGLLHCAFLSCHHDKCTSLADLTLCTF